MTSSLSSPCELSLSFMFEEYEGESFWSSMHWIGAEVETKAKNETSEPKDTEASHERTLVRSAFSEHIA